MKKKLSKPKVVRKELIGKSKEYQDGYLEAEEYYEHIVKGGHRFGSAIYRIYIEAVADCIRDKKSMSSERVNLIEYILKWSDTEFNRGVYDLLVRKANEYRGLKLIEVCIEKV